MVNNGGLDCITDSTEIDNVSPQKSVAFKSTNSLKWSALSQITTKLILPITNMILARILAREIFGIVATLNIVITFAEIFSDSGFSKYIVQKEFSSEKEYKESINVAFWTNFVISFVFLTVITIFNKSIATFIGSEGYGIVLIITAIQIPLYGISSVFTSVLMRDFRFKRLFGIRIISVLLSSIVSISLALLGFSYWALVFSSITTVAVSMIAVWVLSKTKVSFKYSFVRLKEMLSFSLITLFDSLLTWGASFSTIYIISLFYDHDTLGLYKTASASITGIITIFSSIFINVLFSTLSRVQNDEKLFNHFYNLYQKVAAFFIIPASFGIFLTRDLITSILLGSNWKDAAFIIGFSGITNGLFVLMRPFPNTFVIAKGKPIYVALTQLVYLAASIPINIWAASISFNSFVISNSLSLFLLGFLMNFVLWRKYNFNILSNIWNTYKFLITAGLMAISFYGINHLIGQTIIGQFANIIISILLYFGFSYLIFGKEVKGILGLIVRTAKKSDHN